MNKMTSECFKLGIPDYVTIETEEGSAVVSTANREAGWKGTKVEFTEASGYEEVSITSVDAVKGVKVRWSYQWPDKVRFLGDAWERGYGDLEWRGMSGRRIMPWYFLAAVPGEAMCFGVMVQPRAMCYWQGVRKALRCTWMCAAAEEEYCWKEGRCMRQRSYVKNILIIQWMKQ